VKCYYLASPYTHKDPAVVAGRAHQAALATVHLLTKHPTVNIFSPIVHSHTLHLAGMGGDWKTWKAIDTDFIERMDGLVILRLPGWEDSVGVNAEIEIARELGVPIFALDINPKGEFSTLKIFRDE
jgi:hypothetical protein